MAPYVTPLLPVPTSINTEIHIKTPVHAVIFDVYGTLFISASGDISIAQKNSQTAALLKTLLEKYEISLSAPLLTDKVFQAIESDHAVKKNKGIDFPEVLIDQIWMQVLQTVDIKTARRFAVEYEMIANPVYPMPHLDETLKSLKKSNIPIGIISNAQFFTPHLFDLFCSAFPESLGFDPDLIFYSFEYGYAKPSLFLFEQAVRQLTQKGLNPIDVLYVGNDMLNDIYTAHTIGFQTCLFAGDSRSLRLRENDPKCEFLKPDAIIKKLNQLTDMIRSS